MSLPPVRLARPDSNKENSPMSEHAATAAQHHEDEGHSVAGWIGVILILVGLAVAAAALFLEINMMLWIGLGVAALGIVAWPILKLAGLGPKSH